MTSTEMEVRKASLAREILNIDNLELLDKLQKAYNRLKSKISAEEETISKEEVLAGIDAGLREVRLTMDGKLKPIRMSNHYASFKKDFEALIDELEQNPELGTNLGGGLRKIRMKITSKGKGKSGGARVISFTVIVSEQDAVLNLLYIYDKAEQPSISNNEIEELLRKNGLK